MNFVRVEEEILQFWKQINAFQTQVQLTQDCEPFRFYDGPPFATGLPHYGHILCSTIKDIIPRYWSMKGRRVERRFGWDTHGLPVEHEIDKKWDLSAHEVVKQIGIEKYNAECRAIVMRYAGEWRNTIERIGRWIDFDNDYKSMDANFMESCWWAFKRLHDTGQIYRAYTVMPFSTAFGTPLSQMEAKLDERMTKDPAVWVSFPVLGRANTSLVIYTTTPWTLPSNLLIAVNPELEYIEILDHQSDKRYILLESGLSALYKSKDSKKKNKEKEAEAEYTILSRLLGKDMIGWKYEPLFNYFVDQFADCFQVIGAAYVEAGEGTGLVHQAPAFGQEDYDAGVAAGFISPERLPPCPVDDAGRFTKEVSEYAGKYVKDADRAIIKDLKEKSRLLLASEVSHVDKFCWRSGKQLIRKAVSSWFIRVKNSSSDMLINLESTTWVPLYVKEKRFANWISDAHDWNVSRNRYWGTPIPLWVSDDYEEVICVGSVAELRELSGFTGPLDDLHRDKVDGITIPSRKGKGTLRRIDEIFDCWFESGSMPYASVHFPFDFKDESAFHNGFFPADFIAEGLDQTRGWFYTLSVLGQKLFGVSPFKAVIVNGLVLASDGKKMSKSLKNYPDPSEVINKYGADAVRLYLINSPVVRGESLRFQESGIKDVVSKVLLPFWNSYRFFSEQAHLYKTVTGKQFECASLSKTAPSLANIMDRWILATCQSMLQFIDREMAAYRLYTVVPRLLHVIEDLTNYYIRFNRKRLKGTAGLGLQDTETALNTLGNVLFTLARCLAPFVPFLTDHIYRLLKPNLGTALSELGIPNTESVHFLGFPLVQDSLFDAVVERKMSGMQKVIQLARVARERSKIPLKTPLPQLVVIAEKQVLSDVDDERLLSYITEELNVRAIILTSDNAEYGIVLKARVDWPTLGKKLKKNVNKIRDALPKLTQEQLETYLRDEKMDIEGISIEGNDIAIVRTYEEGASNADFEPAFSEDGLVVLLNTRPDSELALEGLTRDIISAVQKLRKKAGLTATDDISMQYKVVKNPDDVDFNELVRRKQDQFQSSLRGTMVEIGQGQTSTGGDVFLEEEHQFQKLVVQLKLCRLK